MNMIHIFFVITASASLFAGDSANRSTSYDFKQFLNASKQELQDYKRQLDELQAQDKLHITPTEAQFFYPDPVTNRTEFKSNVRYANRARHTTHTILKPEQIAVLNKAMATEKKYMPKVVLSHIMQLLQKHMVIHIYEPKELIFYVNYKEFL